MMNAFLTQLSDAVSPDLISILSIPLTVSIHAACRRVYRRWRWPLLSPMLTSLVLLAGLLVLLRMPYPRYMAGAHWLSSLLQPATVAFAVPLYRHRRALLDHAPAIGAGLLCGSVMAVISSIGLAHLAGLGDGVARSLAPRSITTPVAMAVAKQIGGNPVLTAVFVIATGILGILVGPWLTRILRLRTPVGRGALMGMGAHGIGTARAFEMGSQEGTLSSLSMVVAALAGVVLIPLLLPWMNIISLH
ncbi:LrgB family protein [Alicyclobacillus macrosporangiidus]|jgi:predicted murein hydrolase (TIGR00659 family)|uniref:TIGR00659 family protein n=1 Tax=Alicyclobacillus macrosporangiidus TaxID=392015 RepID=A0A1I7FDY6_9BACL|nr:LrgB family protein [Alicyclobacillus macrosporangiidus]SFU34397.1 TIGR00659 family protein [Alicyclobacillus macrosporangiidus]